VIALRLAVAAALLGPSVATAPTAAPQTVRVSVGRADVARGFVAGPGRVVTVAHVLDAPGDVVVAGRRASVLRRDERVDLAVLSVPALDGAPPRVAPDATRVIVDGRPARVLRHVSARVDGARRRRPALELRAHVEPGDSGAPVLTPAGRLVGVVFARSRGRDGVAWAVSAEAVSGLLRTAAVGRGRRPQPSEITRPAAR
jgi:S1-C subfamily serine protease